MIEKDGHNVSHASSHHVASVWQEVSAKGKNRPGTLGVEGRVGVIEIGAASIKVLIEGQNHRMGRLVHMNGQVMALVVWRISHDKGVMHKNIVGLQMKLLGQQGS